MKQILIAIAIGITITSARAATQCVALDPTQPCSDPDIGRYSFEDKIEWTVNCTQNGKTVKMKGIVTTVPNQVGSPGTIVSDLTLSGTGSGYYCLCKTIYPFISNWVFVAAPNGSRSLCANACAGVLTGQTVNASSYNDQIIKVLMTPADD